MAELYRSDIVDVDIGKSLLRTYAGIVLNTGDCKANRFGANIIRAGEPVDISGCTVLAYFMRPNLETLPITGVVEGNTVYVDLPAACYAQEGTFSLAIKVSSTDITQTVRVIDGCIRLTQTDNIIDPGEVVPSLDELFAKIADMEAATAETKQAISDAEAATAKLNQAAESIAPAIQQTVTGGVAHMVDAAERPVLSHVTEIIAVQTGSGDPSPDNIRPITGFDAVTVNHSGRNMFDVDALEQVEINPGEIRWGKRYTRPGAYAIGANVAGSDSDYIYAKVVDGAGATVGSTMYLVAGSAIRSYDVTLTDGQALVVWYVRDLDEETVKESMLRTQVQVESGSKSAYEVGKVASQTAALPETVYGGMLDWTTGVLTVTHKQLLLDETAVWKTFGPQGVAFFTPVADIARETSYHSTDYSLICNRLVRGTHTYTMAGTTANACCISTDSNGIGVNIAGITTLDALKTWLSATPLNVVYELAAPYTIQLDPQTLSLLRGDNTIWCDAGGSAVRYVADTKLYVDSGAQVGRFGDNPVKIVSVSDITMYTYITAEDDGDGIALSAAMIDVVAPAVEAARNGTVRFFAGDGTLLGGAYVTGMCNTTERSSKVLAVPLCGKWLSLGFGSGQNTGNTGALSNYPVVNLSESASKPIAKVEIYCANGLPDGAKIKLWGVRANA